MLPPLATVTSCGTEACCAVSQVLDTWHDTASASAALALRQPAFRAALASQQWARQLVAMSEQELQERLGDAAA